MLVVALCKMLLPYNTFKMLWCSFYKSAFEAEEEEEEEE